MRGCDAEAEYHNFLRQVRRSTEKMHDEATKLASEFAYTVKINKAPNEWIPYAPRVRIVQDTLDITWMRFWGTRPGGTIYRRSMPKGRGRDRYPMSHFTEARSPWLREAIDGLERDFEGLRQLSARLGRARREAWAFYQGLAKFFGEPFNGRKSFDPFGGGEGEDDDV